MELEAFVTVNDHKIRFPLNIECRLLNPGKNYIGNDTMILEKIVNKINLQTKLIQWKNPSEVII